MAERFSHLLNIWEIDEIVPVPIHPKRFKERGFNQALVMAEELGNIIGIPVVDGKVLRIKNTRPQKVLDDLERIKNIKGAFAVTDDYLPKKNILIIDDIYTTGTTIRQIAQILKAKGAERVFFLTISIGQGI